jgi:glycosyltransferase involved in cell wall biosynthesis
MNQSNPRVSIGLAVYNGENYIREAVDSILNQTFTDFELIICDNASTDRTDEICREYAAKDPRVRYYRNERNIGCITNQARVMELSTGEFFKLAAHDDICAPEFLEHCVAALDQNPDAVLAYPKARIINAHGEFFDSEEPFVKYTNACLQLGVSERPSERFREMACLPHSCNHIFGLMRMSAVRAIPGLGAYGGADRSLLARMTLLGRYVEVPKYLFFFRRHSGQSINICKQSVYLYSIWSSTANKGKLVLPGWQMFFEYFNAIRIAPLSLSERISCYIQLFTSYLSVDGSRLIKDLLVATVQICDRWVRTVKQSSQAEPMDTLIFGRFPRLG